MGECNIVLKEKGLPFFSSFSTGTASSVQSSPSTFLSHEYMYIFLHIYIYTHTYKTIWRTEMA